jgi:tetratricopeptide (TPR) repeat protein
MFKKIIIFAFFVSVLFGCSKYYQFDDLYNNGEYIEAYQILQAIEEKDHSEYYKREFQVVTRLAVSGDPDFISRLSNIVEREYPEAVFPFLNFARTFLIFYSSDSQDDYMTVVSNFSEDGAFPDEFKGYAYQIKGISLYKTGFYEIAISELEKSYRINSYIDNLFFIAMSHFGMGENDEAVRYFDRIIRNSMDNLLTAQSHFQKGEILYADGKIEEAYSEYINAANNFCNSANYSFKVGKALQRLGYRNLSPRFFRISLRIDGDFADAWFHLNIN